MNGNLGCFALRPLALFIVVLLSAGCTSVPVGKYDVLAESSQRILNGTSETYTRIEKLQRRFLVETAPDTSLNRETFLPVIDVGGKK
ncbi:MAG: hypothetical protein ACRERU_19855 [Methylococcales bacterium]